MIIELHPNFKKAYKKRVAKNSRLKVQTAERIRLFQNTPSIPILKDHVLKGKKKNFRAFSVTGDVRIVYFPVSSEKVIFMDIGSHNQVY